MTINKRKKFSRQRGRHTHGWGSKKKHRGAGNRGGRGMAGSGKRGDAMKTLYWKDKKYFGKHGFKAKGVKKDIKTVNVDYIEEHLDKFMKDGVIDLAKLGYNKLLGNGVVRSKLNIKVESASVKAVEKVKKAGGDVVLSAVKKEKAESSE
ncbi:uL15 family ribosomal protein [Candidatus Woesearchaeota archaeon]|nr:uL15 family ribosomal protein [Candidatus Woesearchaeota archaeon]